MANRHATIALNPDDALVVVDMQNDFVTGTLAVPRGDDVIEPLNRAITLFEARGLPIFATRDWHPADHCSFAAQGGPWPVHCVAGTSGADYVPALRLPASAIPVQKATRREAEAFSSFAGTSLAAELRSRVVSRLFVGGLATDYCVLNTVRDAIADGFAVVVLADGIRAVDVHEGDGVRAEDEMRRLGARFAMADELVAFEVKASR
jgi:nicotinamidase/pyrazinamidase